jgi:DNA modification methylase
VKNYNSSYLREGKLWYRGEPSISVFTVSDGTLLGVFQGERGDNPELDFVLRFLSPGARSRLRTPKNVHWVVDLLIGMKILNDITWEKPNPPPNLSCRYFTHSTETLLWAAKTEKSKHTFNYDAMRDEAGGKQMKSVWQILPPAKDEKRFGKHPTQKPVALVTRCIRASTKAGDFVLDPFAGSSTTGVAAMQEARRYCGIEKEGEFVDLSKQRLTELRERSTSGA